MTHVDWGHVIYFGWRSIPKAGCNPFSGFGDE
jgi:hypothetical protein